MLRTSVSVCLLVVLGAAGACSSKSTKDDEATAGNGSILGGSSSGGTGGSSSGGTRTDTGGTTTAGGTANGLCPGPTLTCLDAEMAEFCNPNTGVVETFSCIDDAKEIGLNSSGCKMGTGLTDDKCSIESAIDEPCWDGAEAFAFCGGLTDSEFLDLYVSCFDQVEDYHTIIPCIAEYVSPTMMTGADCDAAAVACLGADAAGGAGAGGAPSEPTAGAGGAQ